MNKQAVTSASVLASFIITMAVTAQPVPSSAPVTAPPPLEAQQLFTDTCAGCHGTTLTGGRGPSLFGERFLTEHSDDEIVGIIQNGISTGGMPSFSDQLKEEQIRQIVAYLRIQGGRLKDRPVFIPDPNNQIIRSQKQTFRIEVVAAGIETPWGMAFLPDGRMLVTSRGGVLHVLDRHGHLLPDPVVGTPKVFVRQDGGLLDVALHPDYRRNGWIYLSYTEVRPGVTPAPGSDVAPNIAPPTMTVLVRGRIRNHRWVDNQVIFRAPSELYTTTSDHYGSRFLFDGKGHLFYSLGERHNMANAQDLSVPMGKIHRVNDDGTAPGDNPLVGTPGALPTIWSYGHRNPEGLAFDPLTGLLWESEHGPTGGDEINIIEKGHNYGWGVVSMGLEPGLTKQHQDGMDDPIAFYTPTIAPSGISFYSGDRYPGWKNNLFVAALAGQELLRIEVDGRRILSQEAVFKEYGRVRDVKTGPDGLLYVLLQNPTGAGTGMLLSAPTNGMLIRLVPQP